VARGSRHTDARHERFPMSDGPRGVSWMSAYVQGTVHRDGRFAFAELGGRVGYLHPDGFIQTLAGLRLKAGKLPVWIHKPTTAVRQNQELIGSWPDYDNDDDKGFHMPMDVAIDPLNANHLYGMIVFVREK
jgi:hypothetical protein